MYKLRLHKNIESDLKKLDKSILNIFEKKLKQIIKSPELGKNLWNKNWLDLTWYKKIYFWNQKYRIVYKVEKKEIQIYLVSVWKRDKMTVYKTALERLKD